MFQHLDNLRRNSPTHQALHVVSFDKAAPFVKPKLLQQRTVHCVPEKSKQTINLITQPPTMEPMFPVDIILSALGMQNRFPQC